MGVRHGVDTGVMNSAGGDGDIDSALEEIDDVFNFMDMPALSENTGEPQQGLTQSLEGQLQTATDTDFSVHQNYRTCFP